MQNQPLAVLRTSVRRAVELYTHNHLPMPQTIGALLMELRQDHPRLAQQLSSAMLEYQGAAEPIYHEALEDANADSGFRRAGARDSRREAANETRPVFGVDRLIA